jgi:ATP-binding cassette subfamily B protein
MLSAGTFTVTRTAHYAMRSLRLRLLRHLHALDAAFYERHTVGDLVSRLEQEIDQLADVASDLFPSFLRIVLGVGVAIAVMFALDWRLALVAVPLTLTLALLRIRFGPKLEEASRRSREVIGERVGFLGECLGAAVELQLLSAEAYVRRRYGRLIKRSIGTTLAQLKTEIVYAAAAFGIITVASAAVLIAGARDVLNGTLTIGSYVAFYSYLARLFDPLAAAVATYVRLKRAGGSISRLAELEQRQPVSPAGDAVIEPGLGEIAFENVSFAYSADRPVLRDVSLRIRRGEKLALVGKSGGGKSTLARLLLRVRDCDGGAVRADGVDLRQIARRSLRHVSAFVPSSPSLFRASIVDNVLLGHGPVPREELDRLARIACFDAVVARFPDGWNHVLGPGGAGLSEGEKQRLGILRALVRDRDVLVFDEATGALDAATESRLLQRLDHYVRDRIVLFITHRPAAAEWADRVVSIEEGRLNASHDPMTQMMTAK